jgi:acyl-CoA dehydrogenase
MDFAYSDTVRELQECTRNFMQRHVLPVNNDYLRVAASGCERALTRKVFGKHLSDFANVQDWIGHSRVVIDQARLLTLHAAWRMDRQGNEAARVDVSAIKLVAANLQTRVLDRAIQVFGAMGLTPDTPLSLLWTWGRALHFVDGPDEVHLRVIARDELRRAKANLGATAPPEVGIRRVTE